MLAATPLNAFLFTGWVVNFSLSKKGLQEKLLQMLRLDWSLEMNTKKSKIIIINKQGALIKKFKIYYKNTENGTI